MASTINRRGYARLLAGAFLATVGAIYCAAVWLAGMLQTFDSPDLLAAALTFDLTVTVSAACYFLLIRSRVLPMLALPIVFLGSTAAAAMLLPSEHHGYLNVMGYTAAPLELWLVWQVATKVRTSIRRLSEARHEAGASADAMTHIHEACSNTLGRNVAAAIFASELAMLYYALCSWRVKSPAPGPHVFHYHERCSYTGVLVGFLMLLGFELFAVHLLLAYLWSQTAAWVVTGLSLYGALWLLGDYRAIMLRPILLKDDGILIRTGLRWTVFVRYDQILSATMAIDAPGLSEPGRLNVALMGQPDVLITLHTPAIATGPFGYSRSVTSVALGVDDTAILLEALTPIGHAP